MKTIGLFSGIGGLELGLHRAGHETELLCELEPSACAVLAANFDLPLHQDVRTLRSLPRSDLVVAGFPCQDLSQAGMTAGIAGQKSGIVREVFRLLEDAKTSWVVLENVSFMLELDRGAAMRAIIEAFEELGYRWAYRVMDTCAFGLPQRRERVYVVASREGAPEDVLLADHVTAAPRTGSLRQLAHGFYWTEGTRGLGWGVDCIPTLKNGSTIGIPSPPAVLMPEDGRIIKPDIRDAERLQGFEPDWTKPAEANNTRKSRRWALVGNAVSVPVAEWLGRRLVDPGIYDPARDRPMPDSGKWPRAARGGRGRRAAVDATPSPIWSFRQPLHRFLRFEGEELSERATAGFLKRAEASSLRFAPGFLDLVRAHLARVRTGSLALNAAE